MEKRFIGSNQNIPDQICRFKSISNSEDQETTACTEDLFDNFPFFDCDEIENDRTKPLNNKLFQPTYFHKSYSLPANYRVNDVHKCNKESLHFYEYVSKNRNLKENEELSEYEAGVQPYVFHERLRNMVSWFKDFNCIQKNSVLKEILTLCDAAPQNHLISVAIKEKLHENCPANCEDIVSWLPVTISLYIFTFLDPISLCQSSQVCCTWWNLANEPSLWKRLCEFQRWNLSKQGQNKQLEDYQMPNGRINWKKAFSARYRLHRNWLKGYCHVRTFEGHSQGISCVQFDGSRIVSGSSDKTIKVWKLRTNCQWSVMSLVGHAGTVRCLHLEGNRLVSGSTDSLIKVWDLSEDKTWLGMSCKVTMIGHTETVRCLQVNSGKVVSGSYDKTLKVWDLKTGECRLTLRGHEAAVLCVQFDNVKIISGSSDKTIKVWNLLRGECVRTLCGHQDAVTCLTFDVNKIISGSLDRTIKFWDLNSGTCLSTLDWMKSEGHTGVIRCLQADNWRIVSAGDDKTIKVWSVEGQRLVTLQNHTDGVTCLQFNDSMIISGSYDKTVKLWDFSVC